MVSPVQAAKHKRDLEWAQHLEHVGRTPVYTGVPIPPITAESVFGSASSPPAFNQNDNMDVNDTCLTSTEPLRSPPVTNPDSYLPQHYHTIPDNDFQPNSDIGNQPPSPEPFNEDTENSASEGFQSLEDSAFQAELDGFGDIKYGGLTIITWCIMRHSLPVIEGSLNDYDIAICKLFAWRVRTGMSKAMFSAMPDALSGFLNDDLPSEHILRARAMALSGIEPIRYDCCVKSCVCYAGYYRHLDKCPECKEPRFSGRTSHGDPRPRRQFLYIPLIPRLIAFFQSIHMAQLMSYRSTRPYDPGVFSDIFDGDNYQQLRSTPITVHGKPVNPPTCYFEDDRDMALGLSTDGYGIFTRSQASAWPLIIFIYNLPPELRIHAEHILALGVIPGPNKPAQIDSFLIPLQEELYQLAEGVKAHDIQTKQLFLLHAFLLIIFADFPAIAMLMNMKGVNGISPCRNCKIKAIPVPGDTSSTHYVPLTTNLTDLGRNHVEMMADAKRVDEARNQTAANQIAKETGIKGTPILSTLDSVAFPQSFPLEIMHVIMENTIPGLVSLWTTDYKGLGEGRESYRIDSNTWKAIGAEGSAAGSTIPSVYSPRIPDVSKKGSYLSADMWSFWTLYIAPVLLQGRFKKPEYYTHFVDLAYLLRLCLQFEISEAEVGELRVGFKKWVEDYQR